MQEVRGSNPLTSTKGYSGYAAVSTSWAASRDPANNVCPSRTGQPEGPANGKGQPPVMFGVQTASRWIGVHEILDAGNHSLNLVYVKFFISFLTVSRIVPKALPAQYELLTCAVVNLCFC